MGRFSHLQKQTFKNSWRSVKNQ